MKILIVCFMFTILWSKQYPHVTYDSDTHTGRYSLVEERIVEPKVLKSIQKIVLNGSYKIISNYSRDGVSNFKNGKRHGKQIGYVPMANQSSLVKLTSFYQDGKLLEVGTYKNNIPVGIERQYSEEGKLTSTIKYVDGLASLRREYSSNGNIKREIFYNKNACKEKVLIYKEDGSVVERTYADKVKFDADRLSNVLASVYEKKSCSLEENNYENVVKKYYRIGEIFRNVTKEQPISWEKVQQLEEYTDAIYSNERLVESSLKDKEKIIAIAYFNEHGILRKSYYYDEGISVYINNKDGSKDIIECHSDGAYYIISHYTKYELGLSDSHGFGGYWEGYMDRNLQFYEYKALIRKDKLKEHAKRFFKSLKKEVLLNGDLDSPFVKSKWESSNDNERELESLQYFDEQKRVVKVIDFKSQKTIVYHYFKDKQDNQITCYHRSGSCIIKQLQ